ncbi:O-antigen ligase family protein [Bradyrhizobium iriomotense]|uniref:O-antigen ligase family protein n=1 Tax=Bradyrhizobium iriomotense TaxID=441950 RepID=UPI001B8A78EF|nr:O-antigen ligase family protein [Bradyrhizobium iriomotense]MBR1132231.1 O-antigen ligase family protein [Bradyrhizobium iriomotense]
MYHVIGGRVEQAPEDHQRTAVVLLYCLILVFIYPFMLLISGVDTSVPAALQTENKTIYWLRYFVPLLCIGFALACGKSNFLLHLPPALLLYSVLCLLSVAWSEDPYPSFKYGLRLLLYVVAVAALCEVLSLEIVCRVLLKIFAFIILSSVALAILAPGYGTHQASDASQSVHAGLWRGVTGHKNELGAMASCAMIAFLFSSHLGSSLLGFRPTCLAASVACLIFAGSAGGLVSAITVLTIYFFIYLTWRWPVAFTWLFVFTAGAALAVVLLAADIDTLSLLGRDSTLTGRTAIWQAVLPMIADSPLLGHGYYTGPTAVAGPRLMQLFGPAISDPHNGYLTLLLDTGIAGLSLYLYSVLRVIFMGMTQAKHEGRRPNCFMFLLITPILGIVLAFFEGHPVGDEGSIGTLNFFGLVAIYSYVKQSQAKPEVAREPGRDVGVLI